jgi:hypothetical protein
MRNKKFDQANHDRYDAKGKSGAILAVEKWLGWKFLSENLNERRRKFTQCFDLTFEDTEGKQHRVEAEVKKTCFWNEKGEVAYNPIHVPYRKQDPKYATVDLFVMMDEEAQNFCFIPGPEIQVGFVDEKFCKNSGRIEPFVCIENRSELYHHL